VGEVWRGLAPGARVAITAFVFFFPWDDARKRKSAKLNAGGWG
jgi:hypothetical protein